jgi:hypothetical protein
MAGSCHAAAIEDGNHLFQQCQASPELFSDGFCKGYVAAVVDALLAADKRGDAVAGWRACFPDRVTLAQLQDVVTRFLTTHPQARHMTAVSLVAGAFGEAFPCR